MARSRSTALIAIGAAVFVVGAALTLLAVRGGDDGKVRTSNAPAGAVTPAANQVAAAAGQVAAATVKIPDGKEAVAVQVPKVPGLGGYTEVGDRVNVYGTFKDRQPAAAVKGTPLVKLILSNVEVLAVTATPAAAEGGSATYVLALSPEEAEKVIYLSSFEGIWLSLVKDGAPPVGSTPGRNAQSVA